MKDATMEKVLPVICVDCGGPGLAVQEGCGVRVPFGTRESIVEECAAAIRAYEGDRSLIALHGAAAYAAAAREYAWERKGAELREWYASCGRGL